jgi:hypothetical protein
MTDSVERTTPGVNNDVLATIRLGPLPEIATTSDFASCWKVPAVVIAARVDLIHPPTVMIGDIVVVRRVRLVSYVWTWDRYRGAVLVKE